MAIKVLRMRLISLPPTIPLKIMFQAFTGECSDFSQFSGWCNFGPVFGASSGTAGDGGACFNKGGKMLNTTYVLISRSCEFILNDSLSPRQTCFCLKVARFNWKEMSVRTRREMGRVCGFISCPALGSLVKGWACDGIMQPFPGMSSTVKGTKCRIFPVCLLKW